MLKKIVKKQTNEIIYKFNNDEITYKELYEKATYYGNYLKRQGDNPIIVYGHKSINTFISIFACIASQRAYIPIDTCTPVDRIKKIIIQSNSSLILTDENIDIDNIEILKLNELEKYQNQEVKENSNEIAYIIFTSGSTGEPKGVPISYNNLFNFINWISNLSPLNEYKNINVLNQASFSFDLSVSDIYYSITNNHKLIALDKKKQEEFNPIFEIMNDENINLIVSTPSFMKLCLINKEFNINNYPSLKCLYFCGEQLEISLVNKIYNRFPNIKIINAYGPTEATSAVSAINIEKDMLEGDLLPCGLLSNCATSLTIENNEIILSGPSVFSGYLSNYTGGYYQENNINYYKTGDIGYIEDGKIYCKGRKDSQIKYKGYRIELGDIENNILSIPGVNSCAVIAKYQNEYTVKMLKAFIVLDENYDLEEIKNKIRKTLPNYMLPKQIIELTNLPINCNGKIDRKVLNNL